MFFFFIGGVEQQAGRTLKEAAARCVRCASPADLVELENVLKLFFVPVWRWPGKNPAFRCQDCSFISPHSLPLDRDDRDELKRPSIEAFGASRCGACARDVDPKFRFCPYCGMAL